jgi:hypothetical protein
MSVDWIERLSKQLSLIPFSQDWGICNADASRLNEFLDFYDRHIPEESWEFEELAELIFQSTEDAMIDGMLEDDLRARVVSFIHENAADFPHTLEYWTGLESDDWHLPALIQEAFLTQAVRRRP